MARKSNSRSQYSLCRDKDFSLLTVHKSACDPFSIYSNYFPSTVPVVSDPLHIDVIKEDGQLLFFKDFKSVLSIRTGSNVYICKVRHFEKQIKQYAWEYLYQQFLQQKPVRPDIYYEIKKIIPTDIESSLFGKLTIEKVCKDLNISKSNFDYQKTKIINQTDIPKFGELIEEVTAHGK